MGLSVSRADGPAQPASRADQDGSFAQMLRDRALRQAALRDRIYERFHLAKQRPLCFSANDFQQIGAWLQHLAPEPRMEACFTILNDPRIQTCGVTNGLPNNDKADLDRSQVILGLGRSGLLRRAVAQGGLDGELRDFVVTLAVHIRSQMFRDPVLRELGLGRQSRL